MFRGYGYQERMSRSSPPTHSGPRTRSPCRRRAVLVATRSTANGRKITATVFRTLEIGDRRWKRPFVAFDFSIPFRCRHFNSFDIYYTTSIARYLDDNCLATDIVSFYPNRIEIISIIDSSTLGDDFLRRQRVGDLQPVQITLCVRMYMDISASH